MDFESVDVSSNLTGAIMNPKLVLFDIDKTLIDRKHGDTGKFHYTTEKVFGVHCRRIVTHGMTDQQIIIEMLKKEKIPESVIMPKLEECKNVLADYYRNNMKNYSYTVFSGVTELLALLNKNKIPLGLVTGNIEEVAHLKLKKVRLDKFFKIGGFGSDAIKRPELVRIAIKRAEKRFSRDFGGNTFVIGDSPNDIQAGKEAGAKTIGAATGAYSQNTLKKFKPNYVLPNLRNTGKILDMICS